MSQIKFAFPCIFRVNVTRDIFFCVTKITFADKEPAGDTRAPRSTSILVYSGFVFFSNYNHKGFERYKGVTVCVGR